MNLSAEISALGVRLPDTSVFDRSELASQLSWLLKNADQIESILSTASGRVALTRTLQHLRASPKIPKLGGDNEARAEAITNNIYEALDEYERVSQLPGAWREVRQRLLDSLNSLTESHLPRTIQALWVEIAQNLMPAPWQYPGAIAFRFGVRRATPEAAVVVRSSIREAIATHILNGAEVHNLGLAWFFTKYLTFGRFRYTFMVLDDPAHSMDQPTFRDFCRLLESLIRLHRKKQVALSMVLLLHQDSRALDAARATGAILHTLRWNRNTPVRLTRLKLYGDHSHAPEPLTILSAG